LYRDVQISFLLNKWDMLNIHLLPISSKFQIYHWICRTQCRFHKSNSEFENKMSCWCVYWDTHKIWQTINFEEISDIGAYLKFGKNLRTILLKLETQWLNSNKNQTYGLNIIFPNFTSPNKYKSFFSILAIQFLI